MVNQELIFLDNNSTTRLDSRIFDLMTPFFKDHYANPSSNHSFAIKTRMAIEKARNQVADLLGAKNNQVIFTSGATESINLALKGLAHRATKKHIITAKTEHKAVLESCNFLESQGFNITYLPVSKTGDVSIEDLQDNIRKNETLAVCIMWVNNETGVIQNIKTLSEIAQKENCFFITDATQAVGKIPVNISELNIDLLCFSGHKFHAPKGVGALYLSERIRKFMEPISHGGAHEGGLRSGTLNVPGIIGLGAAAQLASHEMTIEAKRIQLLRDHLEQKLLEIPGSFLNGDKISRIYNTTNICFPGLDSDVLINQLKGIAFSNGSACRSMIVEPSHVLLSMGLTDKHAKASLRFSLSKFNTEKEIIAASSEIKNAITIQLACS